jgi:hypothetical protein
VLNSKTILFKIKNIFLNSKKKKNSEKEVMVEFVKLEINYMTERFTPLRELKRIKKDDLLKEFRNSSIVTKLDENFVVHYYNAWFENNIEEEKSERNAFLLY